jgi:hypothetical protein
MAITNGTPNPAPAKGTGKHAPQTGRPAPPSRPPGEGNRTPKIPRSHGEHDHKSMIILPIRHAAPRRPLNMGQSPAALRRGKGNA